MKFQDLPGMPGIWIDFIAGKCPELSVPANPANRELLHAHLERLGSQTSRLATRVRKAMDANSLRADPRLEGLRQLQLSDSVAVVADVDADLFGGALSQFLKCLTAVKVCRELSRHDIRAVPVCWVYAPRSEERSPDRLVRILDGRSEMHRLSLRSETSDAFFSGPDLPFNPVADLIGRIEDIGKDSFDPETLEILKAAYNRSATWASACTDLFSALMVEWGLVAVNADAAGLESELYSVCAPLLEDFLPPDQTAEGNYDDTVRADTVRLNCREKTAGYYMQSSLLPVFARIVGPDEISGFREAHGSFQSLGLLPPIAWPACSATVVDARRRKILDRYNLRIADLLGAEEEVIRRLSGKAAHSSIGEKFDAVKMAVESQVADLSGPGMDSKSFRRAKERSRKRIVYQVDKIKGRIEAIRREKQAVMQRRIHRACGFLAPDGKRQEESLSGIAFPLRYSRSILSFLYEYLDIMKFEHQLIYME